MGYRQALCQALSRMGIPFAIWAEKKIKFSRAYLHLHVGKFPRNHQPIYSVLTEFDPFGPFTHVIAGTEASVYPASVARRVLNARTSIKSVALRCHDKLHMKSYLHERNIPMTDFVAGDEIHDAAAIVKRLGVPVVIKARHESGGRGIRLVETPGDIVRYSGRNKIMERFVTAPEASVESYVNNGNILFENVTQYYLKKHVNIVPGLLGQDQHQSLLELNRQIIKALKIKWGMTHMEAYLCDDGLLFGEIALRPPGGYIMELISKAYGFSSWDALVHMELDLPFEFNQTASSFTAAYIIHPGAGEVVQIENWDAVSSLPAAYKKKLKIKPSAILGERQGVGEDAGYILLNSNNKDDLIRDIDSISKTLKFVME
jgi:formate-dependent phosphoribosylglycinamide formyltransferase (GAR transformylase)